jgi:hypothetical protein
MTGGSGYKKKPTKFYAWPSALAIKVPINSIVDNNETFQRLLLSFLNQMKATHFTKSYYSEYNWNLFLTSMVSLKSSILEFIADNNQLLNSTHLLQNCEYLVKIFNMVENAQFISMLTSDITTDPGIQMYLKNEGKTSEFLNYLSETVLPAADC